MSETSTRSHHPYSNPSVLRPPPLDRGDAGIDFFKHDKISQSNLIERDNLTWVRDDNFTVRSECFTLIV